MLNIASFEIQCASLFFIDCSDSISKIHSGLQNLSLNKMLLNFHWLFKQKVSLKKNVIYTFSLCC